MESGRTGIPLAMTAKIAIVGSFALRNAGIPLNRVAGDLDVICHSSDFYPFIEKHHIYSSQPTEAGQAVCVDWFGEKLIIEAEFTDGDNASSIGIFDAIKDIYNGKDAVYSTIRGGVKYADRHMLYLLKMSHRYKKNTPHFLKTMEDIHTLRAYGAEIQDQDLYEARMEATYGYKHPNLKRTKAEFFRSDSVDYVYDHDSIHEAVAHLDKPMYQYYAVDREQVLSSQEKFKALSLTQQMYGVLEEAYVLALERSLIPYPGVDPDEAFLFALEKVCTSITSGWFREFAWENYYDIVELHKSSNANYLNSFWDGVANGIVKPYKST